MLVPVNTGRLGRKMYKRDFRNLRAPSSWHPPEIDGNYILNPDGKTLINPDGNPVEKN